jgi:predicted nucleic acid-binding protein
LGVIKIFFNFKEINISIYDGIFLALTIDLDASLITADKKLYEANKNANYKLILLSDFVKESSY